MGGSDSETELKKKKEKKDKDKDKGGKDKEEKKDKGKDKDKDEKKKDKDKDEKKKDKDKDEKKKDKHKDEKKDKKEKDEDKHKDDKKKGKDKKDKKDKKDEDEDEDEDEEDSKKKKKDKDKHKDKDKDKKDKPSHPSGVNVSSGPAHGGEAASYYNPSGAPSQPSQPHSQPAHPSQSGEVPWFLREPGTEPIQDQHPPRTEPGFPNLNPHYTSQQPPQHQAARAVGDVGGGQPVQNAPPSGYRIPLDPNAQFPSPDQLGRPPATDFDGLAPVFIGSAIFPDSVQPCKIVPSLHPPCYVSYGGSEVAHHGRYDLLPITQDMEWVPTRNGQIPPGRRPVEGGYESNGGKLHHALGLIQGVYVPGKAGDHLVSRSKLSTLGRELTIIETSREAQIYRSEEVNTISKKTTASCE